MISYSLPPACTCYPMRAYDARGLLWFFCGSIIVTLLYSFLVWFWFPDHCNYRMRTHCALAPPRAAVLCAYLLVLFPSSYRTFLGRDNSDILPRCSSLNCCSLPAACRTGFYLRDICYRCKPCTSTTNARTRYFYSVHLTLLRAWFFARGQLLQLLVCVPVYAHFSF